MRQKNKHQGFGLLEVLIAALILSIGLLGTITMQTKSMRIANRANNVSTANLLAADMFASMSVNPLELEATDFPGAYSNSARYALYGGRASISPDGCANNDFHTCLWTGGYREVLIDGEPYYQPRWLPGRTNSQDQALVKECNKLPCNATELALFDTYMLMKKAELTLPQKNNNARFPSYFQIDTLSLKRTASPEGRDSSYKIELKWLAQDGEIEELNQSLSINENLNNSLHIEKMKSMPYSLFKLWKKREFDDRGMYFDPSEEIPEDIKQIWYQYLVFYLSGVKRPPILDGPIVRGNLEVTTIRPDDQDLSKAMSAPYKPELITELCKKLMVYQSGYGQFSKIAMCVNRFPDEWPSS